MKLCQTNLNNLVIKNIILVSIMSLFAFSASASSENDYQKRIKPIYSYIKSDISEIHDLLLNGASDANEKIIRKIIIDIPIDIDQTRVRALVSDVPAKIEVSTGFVVLMHQISRAFALGSVFNKPLIGPAYTKYAAQKFSGMSDERILLPEEFVRIKIDSKETANKIEKNAYGMKSIILMHVIAHEMAHIVLNHKLDFSTDKNIILEKSRKNEMEADRWASDFLVKGGYTPMGGFYALLFWYYVDQKAIELEKYRTHPAEVKRMNELAKSSLESINKWWPSDKEIDGMTNQQMKQQIITISEGLRAEIK